MDKKQKIKTAAESGTKTPESPQGMEAPEVATPSETAEATEATKAPEASSSLPADYLSEGYYKGEGAARYIDPDLVGETAQRLAQDLATGGMKQTATNSILRELKRADKKTLPLDAKRGALAGAIVTAKQLQQRHRAPGLLVDLLERNQATIYSDADYKAAVKHLIAVGVYLGDYQQQATEGAKK